MQTHETHFYESDYLVLFTFQKKTGMKQAVLICKVVCIRLQQSLQYSKKMKTNY